LHINRPIQSHCRSLLRRLSRQQLASSLLTSLPADQQLMVLSPKHEEMDLSDFQKPTGVCLHSSLECYPSAHCGLRQLVCYSAAAEEVVHQKLEDQVDRVSYQEEAVAVDHQLLEEQEAEEVHQKMEVEEKDLRSFCSV